MRRGTWLIAGALALGIAAPAQAAPVDLGVGSDPAAVMDPAGTAHIVYDAAGRPDVLPPSAQREGVRRAHVAAGRVPRWPRQDLPPEPPTARC